MGTGLDRTELFSGAVQSIGRRAASEGRRRETGPDIRARYFGGRWRIGQSAFGRVVVRNGALEVL